MSPPRTYVSGDDECMARNEKSVKQIAVGEPGRYARNLFARAAVARLLRDDGGPADQVDGNGCSTKRGPWDNDPPEANSAPLGFKRLQK